MRIPVTERRSFGEVFSDPPPSVVIHGVKRDSIRLNECVTFRMVSNALGRFYWNPEIPVDEFGNFEVRTQIKHLHPFFDHMIGIEAGIGATLIELDRDAYVGVILKALLKKRNKLLEVSEPFLGCLFRRHKRDHKHVLVIQEPGFEKSLCTRTCKSNGVQGPSSPGIDPDAARKSFFRTEFFLRAIDLHFARFRIVRRCLRDADGTLEIKAAEKKSIPEMEPISFTKPAGDTWG